MVLWPYQILHTWKLQELDFEQPTSVYMLNLCNSPFSSHLFLCPLASGFAAFWHVKMLSGLGNKTQILFVSFFVCYKLVLREKGLTSGSREALSSQDANNLWVQLKAERPKLQIKHLHPTFVSLSHMQGGCAVHECDLRTPRLYFCPHG